MLNSRALSFLLAGEIRPRPAERSGGSGAGSGPERGLGGSARCPAERSPPRSFCQHCAVRPILRGLRVFSFASENRWRRTAPSRQLRNGGAPTTPPPLRCSPWGRCAAFLLSAQRCRPRARSSGLFVACFIFLKQYALLEEHRSVPAAQKLRFPPRPLPTAVVPWHSAGPPLVAAAHPGVGTPPSSSCHPPWRPHVPPGAVTKRRTQHSGSVVFHFPSASTRAVLAASLHPSSRSHTAGSAVSRGRRPLASRAASKAGLFCSRRTQSSR